MKQLWWGFLLLAASAGAQELTPRFETGTAFVWGQATELVLRDGTYNDPVSRIVWDVPPSAALYMTLNWPWNRTTATRLSLQGTVPLASGSVADEDWNTGAPDYISHDESVSEGRMTAGWSASIEQTLTADDFEFFGGGLYRLTSWEAWNGTYDYQYDHTQVGTADQSGSFSGLVLEYRQLWLIPYLGASMHIRADGWQLTPSVRLSPYTWCFDTDNHMFAAKRLTFQDSVRGGLYGKLSCEAVTQTAQVTWGMRLGWELAWGATGDTTQTEPGVDVSSVSTYSGDAGAWFHELTLAFFVRN